jgi:methionyl-tRNA formyltransferase
MLMDEGLDTGPILLQKEDPLDPRDTTPQVASRFARLGAELLVETLDLWASDALEPTPQDDAAATLAPSFKKQDGRIDWRQDAAAIDRQVRALQPWPGAHTFVEGQRLAIWASDTEPSSPAPEGPGSMPVTTTGAELAPLAPGTVVTSGPAGLAVACAGGDLLWIEEVQLAGRKRQPVGEFLRGHRLAVGTRLGTED